MSITAIILFALLLTPSAYAVEIQFLNIKPTPYKQPAPITINAKLTFQGDRFPIQKVEIEIIPPSGPAIIGNFNVDGSPQGTPPKAFIKVTASAAGFGYGYLYGYGYGQGYGFGYGVGGYGYGYGANPPIIIWSIQLNSTALGAGTFQIKVNVHTGLSPQPIFSSQLASFQIATPPGLVGKLSQAGISGSSPEFNDLPKTGLRVKLSGATYENAGSGAMTVAVYDGVPSTAQTLQQSKGKIPIHFVDVAVSGVTAGTATIEVTYPQPTSNIDESTLQLFYWDGSSWQLASSQVLNTATNTITGQVPVTALGGTIFAIGGSTVAPPPPAPAPAPGPGVGIVGPRFEFSVSAFGPNPTIVNPGQTTFIRVEVTRAMGSAEPVSLSISGLPAGASAVFTPRSGTPTFSSTLTIATSSTTQPGAYPLTITGVSGSLTRTASSILTVVVTAPPLPEPIVIPPPPPAPPPPAPVAPPPPAPAPAPVAPPLPPAPVAPPAPPAPVIAPPLAPPAPIPPPPPLLPPPPPVAPPVAPAAPPAPPPAPEQVGPPSGIPTNLAITAIILFVVLASAALVVGARRKARPKAEHPMS
ncbi:MAG: hypothetical protein HY619_07265 [Thaumarchaeota archaeon]|nr:hypothetical protein [Nitrososphaerota archaeon]